MGLLDRLTTPRRPEGEVRPIAVSASSDEPLAPTKSLKKLLSSLSNRDTPSILDLGPVIGSNLSFFGEQLGCKIFVEDIYAELERHHRSGTLDALPAVLAKRFAQDDGSIDGILCWDILDYLDKAAAQVLAAQLCRILRPEGALLGFFGNAQPKDTVPAYTKFIIADESNLKHRPYPASRGRQAVLANRDIIKLFDGLRVSDSFLMMNNIREILFRKPAAEPR